MTAFTATISILKNAPIAVIFPYRLLSRPFAWLLSPLLVLLQFGARSLSLLLYSPINVLSYFEILYIYCGSAAIIGAGIGSLVALLAYSLASVFGILPFYSSSSLSSSSSPSSSTESLSTILDPSRQHRRSNPTDSGQYQSIYATSLTLRPGFSHPIQTILEEDEDSQVDAGARRHQRLAKRRAKKVQKELNMWLDDASNRDSISDIESSF